MHRRPILGLTLLSSSGVRLGTSSNTVGLISPQILHCSCEAIFFPVNPGMASRLRKVSQKLRQPALGDVGALNEILGAYSGLVRPARPVTSLYNEGPSLVYSS